MINMSVPRLQDIPNGPANRRPGWAPSSGVPAPQAAANTWPRFQGFNDLDMYQVEGPPEVLQHLSRVCIDIASGTVHINLYIYIYLII